MNVLVIEDEFGAAENLKAIIQEIEPEICIIATLESVRESVSWLQQNKNNLPDLAFFDIHLADGNSFEIFQKVKIEFPVIFTTAYNQYALEAFKVNSIDYLLKPLKPMDVSKALNRYKKYFNQKNTLPGIDLNSIIEKIEIKNQKKFRKSLLVNVADNFIPLNIEEIAIFYSTNELTYCYSFENKEFLLDNTLKELEKELNPEDFYRANRQFILNRKSIKGASRFLGSKLKVITTTKPPEEIIISKAKTSDFKDWLSL